MYFTSEASSGDRVERLLPEEILLEIFSFLTVHERIYISRVNEVFFRVSYSLNHFPNSDIALAPFELNQSFEDKLLKVPTIVYRKMTEENDVKRNCYNMIALQHFIKNKWLIIQTKSSYEMPLLKYKISGWKNRTIKTIEGFCEILKWEIEFMIKFVIDLVGLTSENIPLRMNFINICKKQEGLLDLLDDSVCEYADTIQEKDSRCRFLFNWLKRDTHDAVLSILEQPCPNIAISWYFEDLIEEGNYFSDIRPNGDRLLYLQRIAPIINPRNFGKIFYESKRWIKLKDLNSIFENTDLNNIKNLFLYLIKHQPDILLRIHGEAQQQEQIAFARLVQQKNMFIETIDFLIDSKSFVTLHKFIQIMSLNNTSDIIEKIICVPSDDFFLQIYYDKITVLLEAEHTRNIIAEYLTRKPRILSNFLAKFSQMRIVDFLLNSLCFNDPNFILKIIEIEWNNRIKFNQLNVLLDLTYKRQELKSLKNLNKKNICELKKQILQLIKKEFCLLRKEAFTVRKDDEEIFMLVLRCCSNKEEVMENLSYFKEESKIGSKIKKLLLTSIINCRSLLTSNPSYHILQNIAIILKECDDEFGIECTQMLMTNHSGFIIDSRLFDKYLMSKESNSARLKNNDRCTTIFFSTLEEEQKHDEELPLLTPYNNGK